jgi:Mg-chelatase subunit ChlD
MRRPRWPRERGSVTPLLALGALALAAMAVGGATVGRLGAVRGDAQRAADAAVLAAGRIVQEEGLPFDAGKRARAAAIASRNSKLPVTFAWQVVDGATAVEFTVTASIEVDVPRLIYTSGKTTATARARGKVAQTKYDEVTRRLPKFVLVLDYSGSMSATLPGSGGKSAITVLEESVSGLLDLNLDIDYGAAFYSTSTFATVAVGPGAPNAIRNTMATYTAGGATNTASGLNTARNILAAAEDTGRYVLLVSDGQPNEGGGAPGARNAANNVWNLGGTIFTLHIDWSGGSDSSLANFMKSVSGTPSSRGDAAYYYRATDSNTLKETFKNIVASIVCAVGPLTPPPASAADLRVFLRTAAGAERPLPAVPDLAAAGMIEAYRYDPGTNTVRMTATACTAVLDDGDDIVVRTSQPTLTE